MYLDEVSVYSLFSSRMGAIPKEFTDTQSSTLQGETAGTIGAGDLIGAGLVKSDVKSSVIATKSTATQVLRKSTIQSTFKRLYEAEKDSLALSPDKVSSPVPKIRDVDEFRDNLDTLQCNNWIIDPRTLQRGRLLEVEARLEAEATFKVSTVLSAITEFVEDAPDTLDPTGQLHEAKIYSRLVEKMLSGLVPIQGRAANYDFVTLDGRSWVVHRKLLDNSPGLNNITRYPLYIVGVAEQSLFWKDIRRVLFSNSRFRILCRVAVDQIQDDWTPVKLVHVLESVEPKAADAIRNLGTTTLTAMAEHGGRTRSYVEDTDKLERALLDFAKLVTEKYPLEKNPATDDEIRAVAKQSAKLADDTKARRRIFDQVLQLLYGTDEFKGERVFVAECRELALTRAELDLHQNSVGSPKNTSLESLPTSQSDDQRFLNAEIVAIYW